MKIICLGDSLTFGYGVYKKDCWVSRLGSNSTFSVINKGINGDTSSSLLMRYDRDLLSMKPELLILLIGTNDFFYGIETHKVFDNICFILNDTAQNRITPIVLCPPPVNSHMAESKWSSYIDYTDVNRNIHILSQLLNKFCKENSLSYINLYEIFQNHQTNFDQLYLDGVHPTPLGHDLIYKQLCKLDLFILT